MSASAYHTLHTMYYRATREARLPLATSGKNSNSRGQKKVRLIFLSTKKKPGLLFTPLATQVPGPCHSIPAISILDHSVKKGKRPGQVPRNLGFCGDSRMPLVSLSYDDIPLRPILRRPVAAWQHERMKECCDGFGEKGRATHLDLEEKEGGLHRTSSSPGAKQRGAQQRSPSERTRALARPACCSKPAAADSHMATSSHQRQMSSSGFLRTFISNMSRRGTTCSISPSVAVGFLETHPFLRNVLG